MLDPIPVGELLPLKGDAPSYDDLVHSMRVAGIVEENTNSYQGDTFTLVRQEGMQGGALVGLLVYGWGSCSGCDALESAWGVREELIQLRDHLYHGIRWFTSVAGFIEWIDTIKDNTTLWYRDREEFMKLIERARAFSETSEVDPYLVAEAIKSIAREAKS